MMQSLSNIFDVLNRNLWVSFFLFCRRFKFEENNAVYIIRGEIMATSDTISVEFEIFGPPQ